MRAVHAPSRSAERFAIADLLFENDHGRRADFLRAVADAANDERSDDEPDDDGERSDDEADEAGERSDDEADEAAAAADGESAETVAVADGGPSGGTSVEIGGGGGAATMVLLHSRREADEYNAAAVAAGASSARLHSRVPPIERALAYSALRDGTVGLVFATISMVGTGTDARSVTGVVVVGLGSGAISLLQAISRAARGGGGARGWAVVIADLGTAPRPMFGGSMAPSPDDRRTHQIVLSHGRSLASLAFSGGRVCVWATLAVAAGDAEHSDVPRCGRCDGCLGRPPRLYSPSGERLDDGAAPTEDLRDVQELAAARRDFVEATWAVAPEVIDVMPLRRLERHVLMALVAHQADGGFRRPAARTAMCAAEAGRECRARQDDVRRRPRRGPYDQQWLAESRGGDGSAPALAAIPTALALLSETELRALADAVRAFDAARCCLPETPLARAAALLSIAERVRDGASDSGDEADCDSDAQRSGDGAGGGRGDDAMMCDDDDDDNPPVSPSGSVGAAPSSSRSPSVSTAAASLDRDALLALVRLTLDVMTCDDDQADAVCAVIVTIEETLATAALHDRDARPRRDVEAGARSQSKPPTPPPLPSERARDAARRARRELSLRASRAVVQRCVDARHDGYGAERGLGDGDVQTEALLALRDPSSWDPRVREEAERRGLFSYYAPREPEARLAGATRREASEAVLAGVAQEMLVVHGALYVRLPGGERAMVRRGSAGRERSAGRGGEMSGGDFDPAEDFGRSE